MSPEPPVRGYRLLLLAAAVFGLAALALFAAALLYVGDRSRITQPPPASRDTPGPVDAGTSRPMVGWDEVPSGSPLLHGTDVAFAAGAFLVTDGKQATYDSGDGTLRPLEVTVPISRVFSGSGKLFAAGTNEGAPFVIVLAHEGEPAVVPMPCEVTQLVGEGALVVGACRDGASLALSRDGGKSFGVLPVEMPKPQPHIAAEVDRAVEAMAVSPSGAVGAATSQRWQTAQGDGALFWAWGQVALRPPAGKAFGFSNVHGLVRSVGLRLEGGGTWTLAALEVAPESVEQGRMRARIFRGTEGEPPAPIGVPGPDCGSAAEAPSVEGVLLGTHVAAFRCDGVLAMTLDGGASWTTERVPALRLLRGGDMRLLVRAGDRAWERRFLHRSETGATAVRVLAKRVSPIDAAEPKPITPPFGIREPAGDGGNAAARP